MSVSDEEIRRLKESEEKYRKMFEMANAAIFVIDAADGTVLEVNRKTAEMLGRDSAELVGQKVWNLHPPEDIEAARELFEKVAATGEKSHSELHFQRGDGSRITVDVSAVGLTVGNKSIILRICRDVTARRRLERQADAQTSYYEHILNMMPVGLGVKGDINKAEPRVEFENKKLIDMFHREGADPDHCHWYSADCECLGTGTMTPNEDGVYTEEKKFPDGRIFQFTLSYYRDEFDNWRELQVVRDVTERRRLKSELQQAKENLERRVDERTRELKEKQTQLIQAEKMAALGNLVAGVAHEINSPLGALKSNNDLFIRSVQKLKDAIDGCDDSQCVRESKDVAKLFKNFEKLNRINKTAAVRIVDIVNSLRKFARLDRAEKDRVDLHDGINSTLTLVHHDLKDRIEVRREFGDIPPVDCYPNQLNQVFMNLLVNAAQAIDGKGVITIRTYSDDGKVVLEFSDTGAGIAAEHLKKIFDPGFTTKGAGVGTGLGLSIVHQIIQGHNGTITVNSKKGNGTTFRIVLPVR